MSSRSKDDLDLEQELEAKKLKLEAQRWVFNDVNLIFRKIDM